MNDISKIKSIIELYKNRTYIDLYGTQLIIFILLTIFEIVSVLFLSFKKYAQYYKKKWEYVRCDPSIMPFAGLINRPDNESILEYTQNNYNYCSQKGVNEEMAKQFEPYYESQKKFNDTAMKSNANSATLVANNNEMAENTQDAVNSGTDKITKMVSIMNYGYTIFMSFFSNITDIMTGFFQFILTGVTWSTMFTKILVYAVKVILVLFFIGSVIVSMPTWWLIIPLAIPILYILVMIIVFKFSDYVDVITSSMSKVEPFTLMKPKPSLCFDKNTRIQTITGYKKIKKIRVGDILKNGETVTATFKTICHSRMFNLNGIIVSENHRVFKDKWIKVKNHPESIEIRYNKKFLYCLNTTSKKIIIGDYEFMDWDELNNKGKKVVGDYLEKRGKKRDDIHSMNKGYSWNLRIKTNRGYKKICRIQPGDICYGSKILAKVAIDRKRFNVVTDTGYFKNKRDYNFIIDKLFCMY